VKLDEFRGLKVMLLLREELSRGAEEEGDDFLGTKQKTENEYYILRTRL